MTTNNDTSELRRVRNSDLERLVSYINGRIDTLEKEYERSPENSKTFKAVIGGQMLEASGMLIAIEQLLC